MSVSDGGEDDRAAQESGMGTRTRIAIGGTALAALLGGGAYLITTNLTNGKGETTEVGAMAPQSAPPASPASAASLTAASPSVSPPSIAPRVRKQIEEAREKMRKDGVEVVRPAPPKPTKSVAEVSQQTVGSLKEGGIVRVVSARGDLTGQRELAWVAGGVTAYKGMHCSQTFQFNSKPAEKKDNLLLCWRATDKKSVVAIVVDPKGKPSKDKAKTALEERWNGMG
jgi:hypothetical protein